MTVPRWIEAGFIVPLVGVDGGPGQEPSPVVRIGRTCRVQYRAMHPGEVASAFRRCRSAGELPATRLCLVAAWLDGLSAQPPVTSPATSKAEGDDVDIGTSIFVP